MPGIDTRRVIGSKVLAKAMHVTNLVEYMRRYGSNTRKKELTGIAVELIRVRPIKYCNSTCFVVAYSMRAATSRMQLSIFKV